jgi:hypothetical protein
MKCTAGHASIDILIRTLELLPGEGLRRTLVHNHPFTPVKTSTGAGGAQERDRRLVPLAPRESALTFRESVYLQ